MFQTTRRALWTAAASLALCTALHTGAESVDTAAVLDSIEASLPALEAKVRSTLMFGGSSPVSFSGEARIKAQYHNFAYYPDYIEADRTYVQSGWEGNENLFRLGMIVRPGRNALLYSKLGFQHTMAGNIADGGEPNDPGASKTNGFKEVQSRHDKANVVAAIHEDMAAGLALRTVPASFWVRMGNVLWTEASPFTIWKGQPRTFAWEYLPFEIEQPIARYYEYNIARGEKTGRAAWHKKPFNGINLESISLPWNLHVNLLYGTMERYDNFEREYVDFANDLALADFGNNNKGTGIGDSYRHLIHARIAKKRIANGLTFGFNMNLIDYRDDFIYSAKTKDVFGVREITAIDTSLATGELDTIRGFTGRVFYKEPKIVSFDLRGQLTDKFSAHVDIAASRIDTTWMTYDTSYVYRKSRASSELIPAGYAAVACEGFVPVEADLVYIPRGFYSPFSFAAPVDAFYAFGAHMLGAGKFMGRGEGSPYVQNMAGAQVTITPRIPGYGHLKCKYGQHVQPERSRDLLFFPYRLNGQDFFSVFHSSYNRWGNGLVDHSIAQSGSRWFEAPTRHAYDKRIGDESHRRYADDMAPAGPDAGGLHSDYLTMYESFVPYESVEQATANVKDSTGIYSRSTHVPSHRKYTFNLDLDVAYDIGPLTGYSRDLFIGGYASVNGVSTKPRFFVFNDRSDDVLLWSLYLRFEPAIALSKKFYALGLLGFENWRSRKAYQVAKQAPGSDSLVVYRSPIDYRDAAWGVGFDWDALERVGIHARLKWMRHKDMHDRDNDWATPVISAELKTWF